MNLKARLPYVILLVLLAVDIILLGLFYTAKQKTPRQTPKESLKPQVKPRKPEVVFENHYKEIEISLDTDKTLTLLQESGFLQGYLAVDLTTLRSYNPEKIIIALYSREDFHGLPLMEKFEVGGMASYGYLAVQSEDVYRLEFYFNPDYMATLKSKDADYSLNSALVKAITRLSALHKKKDRLSREEEREVLRQAVDYLHKFKLVYVGAQ